MIFFLGDDKSISDKVIFTLRKAGYSAAAFEDGKSFFCKIGEGELPDLIFMDIILAEDDGIPMLKKINKLCKDVPVILVTDRGPLFEKAMMTGCWADGDISKPVDEQELISCTREHLRALGRRKLTDREAVFRCGKVELDIRSRTVTANGIPTELTRKEFELLRMLIKHKNKPLSRDFLLEHIWGYEQTVATKTVDVHIKTLRQKLGDCSEIIKTVKGAGYMAQK